MDKHGDGFRVTEDAFGSYAAASGTGVDHDAAMAVQRQYDAFCYREFDVVIAEAEQPQVVVNRDRAMTRILERLASAQAALAARPAVRYAYGGDIKPVRGNYDIHGNPYFDANGHRIPRRSRRHGYRTTAEGSR